MKGSALLLIVAMFVACGGRDRQADARGNSYAPPKGDTGAAVTEGTTPGTHANDTVTLVGCLEGLAARPTGTTGNRAPDEATGAVATGLRLTHARVASDQSPSGQAADQSQDQSGAGASTSYTLEGIRPKPDDINKEVRVTGRMAAATGAEARFTVEGINVIAASCQSAQGQ